MLDPFAKEVGAGEDHIVILVLDNAGWHTQAGLRIPRGLRLVHLPPYTPKIQPAETLWVHVDEPIANKHFDTIADLDDTVAAQCLQTGQKTPTASKDNAASIDGQTQKPRIDQPEMAPRIDPKANLPPDLVAMEFKLV